jgi:hypothetical protein
MKQDRFLIGILVGIGLLMVLAVTLFLTRQKQQNYVAEDNPKGVVQNYVLALYKKDYTKAYSYLADQNNKPTPDNFRLAFLNLKFEVAQSGIKLGDEEISGSDASLTIVVISGGAGPFNDMSRNSQSATLRLQNGAWKITSMPYPYWDYSWFQPVKAIPAP